MGDRERFRANGGPGDPAAFEGDPARGTLVGVVGSLLYLFVRGPSDDASIDLQVAAASKLEAMQTEFPRAFGILIATGPNAGFPNGPQRRRIVGAFQYWARLGVPVLYLVDGDPFRMAILRSVFTSMTLMVKVAPGSTDLTIAGDQELIARTAERRTRASAAEVLDVVAWARRTIDHAMATGG